ncbi:hypothetical protein ACNSOS_09170 [Aliarcobacter vitoriensis]|uniref:hypothetical protein n=1 Tax=Aliarcobacter vitoriensis TaxID=2011099 RepID=UPI003AB0C495
MPITRNLALKIIKYLIDNPSFNFPFLVMCKGYGIDTDDNDFLEIVPEDDYADLVEDSTYDTFELWENLQNLDVLTIELMLKGFLEKILLQENTNLLKKEFIFITFEGYTFQPNSEEIIPDIENMQVIGFSNGVNSNEAFKNLKKEKIYLEKTNFDEIIAIELKEKKFEYFNLKN